MVPAVPLLLVALLLPVDQEALEVPELLADLADQSDLLDPAGLEIRLG